MRCLGAIHGIALSGAQRCLAHYSPSIRLHISVALPTDCLRVLEFTNGTFSYPQDNIFNNSGGPVYVIEGRNLLTDETVAKVKYIAKETDTNLYDSLLVETLSARLAYEICYALTGSNSQPSIYKKPV